MNDMPEPMSAVEEGAVAAHEMYTALVKAGFSETQALSVVSSVLVNAVNKISGEQ